MNWEEDESLDVLQNIGAQIEESVGQRRHLEITEHEAIPTGHLCFLLRNGSLRGHRERDENTQGKTT